MNKLNKKLINLIHQPTVSLKPRVLDPIYISPTMEYKKPQWSFELSVFKEYKNDTQVIFNNNINYNLLRIYYPSVLSMIGAAVKSPSF